MDTGSKPRVYEFSGFRLDVDEHELWRGSEQVPVTHKAIELLKLLVEHRGTTVTKEEILEKLWPETYIDENNLAVTVSMLRKAFGERAFDRKFIETIPKRGYRFVADVKEPSLLIEKHTLAEITVREPGPRKAMRQMLVIAVPILVLAVGALYFALNRVPTGTDGQADLPKPKVRTIAVLPLKDLSGKHDDSVCIGLTDALITKLGALRGLAVRPTGAVLALTGTPQEIGEKLRVESVLHGTIQRDGENIRVAVQLINVADNSVIWTSNFDDKYSDLFKIQDAFAAQIANNLSLTVSEDELARLARRDTNNSKAYEHYVKGRYFWNQRTKEAFVKAIDEYEQAIAIDPGYAHAHAGIADAYLLLGVWGARPPREVMIKAKQAAAKAS